MRCSSRMTEADSKVLLTLKTSTNATYWALKNRANKMVQWERDQYSSNYDSLRWLMCTYSISERMPPTLSTPPPPGPLPYPSNFFQVNQEPYFFLNFPRKSILHSKQTNKHVAWHWPYPIFFLEITSSKMRKKSGNDPGSARSSNKKADYAC